MLLPKIAETLGVSLTQLYGIDSDRYSFDKTTADRYPALAFEWLHDSFFHAAGCRFSEGGKTDEEQLSFQKESMKKGELLGCLSNTAGAAVLSEGFAFVDTEYKEEESGVLTLFKARSR